MPFCRSTKEGTLLRPTPDRGGKQRPTRGLFRVAHPTPHPMQIYRTLLMAFALQGYLLYCTCTSVVVSPLLMLLFQK